MRRKRFSAWGLVAVAILVSLLSLSAKAHEGTTHQATENSEPINKSLHWLETVQQANGAIVTASDTASDFQATAEALHAATLVDGGTLDNIAALAFLDSAPKTLPTEQLARLIIGLQDANQSSAQAIQLLLARQGADGGFGDYAHYDSSPLDTAYALLALQKVGRDAAVAGRALSYLSSSQLATGGFGYYGNQSSTMVTALVVKALKPYLYTFNISSVLSSALEFLHATKSDSHRWSSDWESSLALQALIPLTTDVARYQDAVDALEARQREEGSWENQAYSTALAVSVLNLLANLEVPADPEKALVRGRLVDSVAGSALTNAQIDVREFDREAVSIDNSGQFVVSNLESGSYLLVYSAPGYLSASQNLNLQKGQFADVGTIRLSVAPSASLISGVFTDIATGQPVAGAVVSVTVDGVTASALSNTRGEYQLLAEPGEAVLHVSADSYHPISAAVSLSAGTAVKFSPSLLPSSESPPASTSIGGTVLRQDGRPIPNVSIHVTSDGASAVSSDDGRFVVDNLGAGEAQIQFAKAGYETVSVKLILPEKTRVNLGNIILREQQVLPSTSISGQVLDLSNGLPVAGASVVVGGARTTTDNNGFYSLRDIPVLEFTVQVTASGYLFTNKEIALTDHRDVSLNLTIRKADLGGVEIAGLSSNASRYGAYEPVLLTAQLENNTALTLGARLYVKVKNAAGTEVAIFSGQYLPPLASALDDEELAHYQQHLDDAVEHLAPGEQRDVQLEQWWNTQNTPPGDYVITVQAVDAVSSNLVSEKNIVVTVEETRKLASLRLFTTPGYVLLNRVADIAMSAELLNRSNVPTTLTLDYQLIDPSGHIFSDSQATIALSPGHNNLIVELGQLSHQFSESGDYLLKLSNMSGAEIVEAAEGGVFVPPSIRLDIEQSIAPNEVVPLEGVGVKSNIQIKGVDGE